ncbi:MAG TPA: LysR family transcriptional regulator [Terriglobales bacterium]
MDNLRRLDLNLLVTLDALLTERSVTRAAQRLNFSQPSVSVQLAKLRETLGDPLLLPGPRGMLPTARAEELREPLKSALEGLRRAILPAEPFDPAKASQTWRIAAADYGELAILMPSLGRIRALAPRARLAVFHVTLSHIAKQAEKGEIDLAFQTMDAVASGLRSQELFDEHYVLVGRKQHPRLKRRPTLAQFCSFDHVVVSPEGGNFRGSTDAALEKAGMTRRVVLSVPHFLTAMSVVESTDLVAMLPSRLVHHASRLQVVPAPVNVPKYTMGMVWHERSHRDPAHQWLRDQIAGAL